MGALLGFKEEDGAMAEVEVDEVFSLVGDKRAEIPPHDAVPGWALSVVELHPESCQRVEHEADVREARTVFLIY